MNRLGMLIDLSHSSDLNQQGNHEASKAPCCFTHTFAKEIFDIPGKIGRPPQAHRPEGGRHRDRRGSQPDQPQAGADDF